MVSVLCLTALFSRPEVAELCFMGLNRLRSEFNIQPLAVYTGDFAPLCKRYDVIGLEYKNQPLGEKFNAGLREALKRKWDYLMTIGSDDLIANELLRMYHWDSEAFGITRCGMLDLRTGRKKVFNNSYPIGLGRCVRRDVLADQSGKGNMKKIAVALLLVVGVTFASEEEFLDWTSASVQVAGTPEAGEISISATVGSGVWSSLTINAFGKTHVLNDDELSRLQGFPLSSMQSTHEQGYEELGGYTVHFRFDRTFYSAESELVTEVVYVSVNREGLSLSGPWTR